MYDGDDYSLEGDMSVPTSRRNNSQPGQPDFNTLDEPIKETIVSDLGIIQSNLLFVTRPRKSNLILVTISSYVI